METSTVKAFQVRLPADLHSRLETKARALKTSMNKLVEQGLRSVMDDEAIVISPDLAAVEAKEELVAAGISGEIGALKGIAQHYTNLGLSNLASLLYALAAEVAAQTDRKQASKELLRTAGRVPRQRHELKIGLLRSALRHNPENEVAKNRLGQELFFINDYSEAVKYLVSVRERDNRAKLFHGWAALHIAREADNRSGIIRARDEIVVALQAWAFGSQDNRERARWLRQVAALEHLGTEYQQSVDELLDYANDNTSWNEVARADIQSEHVAPLAEAFEGLDSD